MSNESMTKAADSNPREVFDDFADVVARLSESEAILAAELQHLAFRTSQVSDRLRQVQTALAALRGQQTQSPPKCVGRTRKDSTSPTTIVPMVEAILRDRGTIPQNELLSQVKQHLLSQGITRVGVKSMMAKTLANSQFKIAPDGKVSLA